VVIEGLIVVGQHRLREFARGREREAKGYRYLQQNIF
jgi:hypothetical protein